MNITWSNGATSESVGMNIGVSSKLGIGWAAIVMNRDAIEMPNESKSVYPPEVHSDWRLLANEFEDVKYSLNSSG